MNNEYNTSEDTERQNSDLHSTGRSARPGCSLRSLLTAMTVTCLLIVGTLYGLYRYYYPLGMAHRCDLLLWFALIEYAEKHNGDFPAGEATPEASLSLVHSLDEFGHEYAYLLRRRDVPEDLVQQMLKAGQLLGPDTCGWNYVEGLRRDSLPNLALFWDKEGLGHNGERLSGGGHIVTFVNCDRQHITEAEWPEFLAEQHRLLTKELRERKRVSDTRYGTERLRLGRREMSVRTEAYHLLNSSEWPQLLGRVEKPPILERGGGLG